MQKFLTKGDNMLNIENFITKIRTLIKDELNITIHSPDLPQSVSDIGCITSLNGSTINSLTNDNLYNGLQFRILYRGTQNDTLTRAKIDSIFNYLHLLKDESFTDGNIINIIGSIPIYAGRDENENILYNTTFIANVEGE